MCTVYGNGAVADIILRKSFARFKSGDFERKDRESYDRTAAADVDQNKSNSDHTALDIVKSLQKSYNSNVIHLNVLNTEVPTMLGFFTI